MRQLSVEVHVAALRGIYRVVELAALAEQWQDDLRFLVLTADAAAVAQVAKWREKGLRNVVPVTAMELEEGRGRL